MKDIKQQCTTLEQSKKLVELGFTKDSASLMWENFSRIGRDIDERLWAIGFAGGMHPVTTHLKLPCWTIADMMKIINQVKRVYFDRDESLDLCTFFIIENRVIIQSDDDEMQDTIDFVNDNLRDSLFNCIVWLKANKYL